MAYKLKNKGVVLEIVDNNENNNDNSSNEIEENNYSSDQVEPTEKSSTTMELDPALWQFKCYEDAVEILNNQQIIYSIKKTALHRNKQ